MDLSRPGLLVTGATGYLGHRLIPLAAARTSVVGASRQGTPLPGATAIRLDLSDARAVADVLRQLRPRAVVHAAAANPGAPGSQFDAVNVLGTRHLARAVGAVDGCRLVHVSTDMVHDGRHAPYDDEHPAAPLSAYGRSKAAGEDEVLAQGGGAVVVRTSLIFGLDRMDRGTAGFAATLERGDDLVLFADVQRQPVWVDSLALALVDLALDRPEVAGRINVAGRQVLSRAQFGRRLLDHWDVPGRDRLVEGSAAGLADVPLDLRLRLDRADALGYELPGVDDVLALALRR